MSRELDAQVAEAMGYVWIRLNPCHERKNPVRALYAPDTWEAENCVKANGDEEMAYGWLSRVPHYSTNLAAAWQVVEWMVNNGGCPALIYDDNGHWALTEDGFQMVPTGDEPQSLSTTFWIEADQWYDTAPEAICREFLKGDPGSERFRAFLDYAKRVLQYRLSDLETYSTMKYAGTLPRPGGRMSYTPGPWMAYTYAINRNLATVCDDDNHVICNVVDGHLANARLIAAAPELLEACEAMCAMFESHGRANMKAWGHEADGDTWRNGIGSIYLEHYDVMRSAIAKAKGDE